MRHEPSSSFSRRSSFRGARARSAGEWHSCEETDVEQGGTPLSVIKRYETFFQLNDFQRLFSSSRLKLFNPAILFHQMHLFSRCGTFSISLCAFKCRSVFLRVLCVFQPLSCVGNFAIYSLASFFKLIKPLQRTDIRWVLNEIPWVRQISTDLRTTRASSSGVSGMLDCILTFRTGSKHHATRSTEEGQNENAKERTTACAPTDCHLPSVRQTGGVTTIADLMAVNYFVVAETLQRASTAGGQWRTVLREDARRGKLGLLWLVSTGRNVFGNTTEAYLFTSRAFQMGELLV